MDSEQAFMQMRRTMIQETKIQQQMQHDLQKQNRRLLERLVQPARTSSQVGRLTNQVNSFRQNSLQYGDQAETKRKAHKAFSSHFLSKLFARKFGDNWIRHRDNFVHYCQGWEIPEPNFPDYLKEMLKGEHLTSSKI